MNTQLSRIQAAILFHLLPRVGPSAYWKIADTLGPCFEKLWDAEPSLLSQLFPDEAQAEIAELRHYGKNSRIFASIEAMRERCLDEGITILAHGDADYPELLAEIPRPPPLLFVLGKVESLSLPQLAIVGSRKPSPQGKENARNFARVLGEGGLTITSGLALGIDGIAHRGALDARATTIAVLACGLDRIYPQRHCGLANEILESGGAIVSEFLPGVDALREHFPQRNRIISGLSYGTLVVEAAVKSGSLISARYALQQNREVFAIPGSIHNPLARGCHALIREGATLVETADDVARELNGFLSWHCQMHTEAKTKDPLSAFEQKILDALGFDGAATDNLVERTGFSVAELSTSLLALELKGLIEEIAGIYMRRSA